MKQPIRQTVENILSDTNGRKGEKRKTITWNYTEVRKTRGIQKFNSEDQGGMKGQK